MATYLAAGNTREGLLSRAPPLFAVSLGCCGFSFALSAHASGGATLKRKHPFRSNRAKHQASQNVGKIEMQIALIVANALTTRLKSEAAPIGFTQ